MKKNRNLIISIILMAISACLLFLAILYYDFTNKIKEYKYTDKVEYQNIKEGLSFLDKLPIHFNIINKYFSNMNNLSQKEKEQIVLAYAIKNKYKLYECGPSTAVNDYLCINKADLLDKVLLDKFNLQLEFVSDDIDVYVDDYGIYNIKGYDTYYKITLNKTKNKDYRLYSVFDHYKEINNTYIFYLYQGYYNGNCSKGEVLNLYDFMSGDSIYSNTCNGNNKFTLDPGENVEKLTLYKYELKKDKNDNYYLTGYNPVK